MIKSIVAIFLMTFTEIALACPGCLSGEQTGRPGDKYLPYILISFIALFYIPFYFMFKMIFKNRKSNID